MTKGIFHCAGSRQRAAPGVVGIVDHSRSGAVQNAYHIALQVGYIVVDCVVIVVGVGIGNIEPTGSLRLGDNRTVPLFPSPNNASVFSVL